MRGRQSLTRLRLPHAWGSSVSEEHPSQSGDETYLPGILTLRSGRVGQKAAEITPYQHLLRFLSAMRRSLPEGVLRWAQTENAAPDMPPVLIGICRLIMGTCLFCGRQPGTRMAVTDGSHAFAYEVCHRNYYRAFSPGFPTTPGYDHFEYADQRTSLICCHAHRPCFALRGAEIPLIGNKYCTPTPLILPQAQFTP